MAINKLSKLNVIPAIFIIGSHLMAIIGLIYLGICQKFCWSTGILAGGMYMATSLSITCGYHRLFSHRSYQANKFIKFLLLFFGAATFQNSAVVWCNNHRLHHKYTDTERDPYNIKQGFFHAHMGWMLFGKKNPIDSVKDLQKDGLVVWQDRYYLPIAIFSGLVLPMSIASFWGDIGGALILAGFVRVVLTYHATWAINSFNHYFGSQPYHSKDTARDNWLVALITFGEGYHNYHHAYPYDYRNGARYYHWDPAKWLIRLFAFVGVASNLRRARKAVLSCQQPIE